jgi:hypothetical protein
VAAGDVNGDGFNGIVVGSGIGRQATALIFDGRTALTTHTLLGRLNALSQPYEGGVVVAVADLNGDGFADITTGPETGLLSTINVFSGKGLALVNSWTVEAIYQGGATLAAGDINGDGVPNVVIGTGPGSQARVFVYDGATAFAGPRPPAGHSRIRARRVPGVPAWEHSSKAGRAGPPGRFPAGGGRSTTPWTARAGLSRPRSSWAAAEAPAAPEGGLTGAAGPTGFLPAEPR